MRGETKVTYLKNDKVKLVMPQKIVKRKSRSKEYGQYDA